MKQEDYNSMMKYPWENLIQQKRENKSCPKCGEKYLGNGIDLCAECDEEKSE